MTPPPPTTPAPRSLSLDWAWVGAGAFLLVSFAGLSAGRGGFFIDYHAPFTWVGFGEVNLWLGALVLLTPGAVSLGVGLRRPLARLVERARDAVTAASPRERAAGLGLGFAVLTLAAAVGNALVLDGFPITDDEWAARFGGEALALGKVLAEVPFDLRAFPTLFMWTRGSGVTSFDWLFAQVAWAVAELSGTGNLVFALMAALPVPALAVLMARRLGAPWGLATAGFFAATPMAALLSLTTHAHLHSRAFVALVVLFVFRLREAPSPRLGALAGLCLGLALIARPFESAALLTPLLAQELWLAVRHRGARLRAVGVAAAVTLAPIALMLLHARAVTGTWVPARHAEGTTAVPTMEPSLWVRFGLNSAYNDLRLVIFTGGLLGLGLALLGLFADGFTLALGVGIGLMSLLGLAHDNYGLHAIGPIHFSEVVVPFTVLALHGAARLVRAAPRVGVPPLEVGAVLACGLLVSNGTFFALQARGLAGQARIQSEMYALVEGAVEADRPAVVLAPNFGNLWSQSAAYRERGSWVFEWRRPRPDFSDPVLILLDEPAAFESVRRAFPDRRLYRLSITGDITPADGPSPVPLAEPGSPTRRPPPARDGGP